MRSAWTSSKWIKMESRRQPTRASIAHSYATTSMGAEIQHWWLIHDPVVDASTGHTVGTFPIRCWTLFSPFSSTAFNETPNSHAANTVWSILCLAHSTRGLAQAGQY
ncbi:hypothetical protein BDQ94DRAFT_164655 [Aspergillus welwitschiae]|uniref:Uncharacterized protein n=1 Tax=Aspergillus welwitschiae TaxID=1341132 RepID=A0A3F3PH15_9EURO|nr:hypothetical protein BDQ94DRAFT_164655 [Aspergillus welwitschiae]RDH26231.1 hypothetical protein BDQ94DRAFT_164655 [Aspergillus welwitschiae]